MKVSTSRRVDDAKHDIEWPGVDHRKLRQTTLFGSVLPAPRPPLVQTKITDVGPREREELVAPLSPSLRPRLSEGPLLTDVAPGQLRISSLVGVVRGVRT